MKTVTPSIEFSPERIYKQNKNIIKCFDIKNSKLLFNIVLENNEYADMLMNDLYYGEYTGA
jgi:hypothetical protein